MTTIITITNRKGGVGKTTTAVTLAHGLALQGKPVLLLDLDVQGSCATALGLDREPCAVDALEGRRAPHEFVRPTNREHLDLIPGNGRSALIEQMHRMDGLTLEGVRAQVDSFADGYEYLVIDTAPSGYLQEVGIYLADHIIVPAKLDYLSVTGVVNTMEAIREIGARYERTPKIIILPTFAERTNEARSNHEDLTATYDGLLAAPIPKRVEMEEAVARAETIWEYKFSGDVALAYSRMISERLGVVFAYG